MQYKTVTVERPRGYIKHKLNAVGDAYQEIINQHAACGWVLHGIHPMPIKRIFLWFWAYPSPVDVLIFFREDGDNSNTPQE